MKISVHEAFILAQSVLPTSVSYELVLFGDEDMNNRAITALVSKESNGLNALNLVHLGLARDYNEADKLIRKATQTVDKKKKK